MDGTAEAAVTESTPAPAPEVTQEQAGDQQEQQQSSGKPPGFDPVDIKTATPEEIQARLDRLYGNTKRSEKEAREYKQQLSILTERFEEINQRQEQVISHIQGADYQQAENQLRAQQRTAWEKGDLDGYHAATERLIEVKTQKAISDRQPRQQKPQENNNLQQNRALSATEALEMSVAAGETPPDKANILRAYFGEADSYGNLKRPWANASDVRFTQASKIGSVVFDPEHPVFGKMSFKQQLSEMDRQMGVVNTQPAGSNVLPAGNLTRPGQKSTVKLTADEDRIAVRTKFAGSKPNKDGKSPTDEDHREAYRQAKMKHSQNRSR